MDDRTFYTSKLERGCMLAPYDKIRIKMTAKPSDLQFDAQGAIPGSIWNAN